MGYIIPRNLEIFFSYMYGLWSIETNEARHLVNIVLYDYFLC